MSDSENNSQTRWLNTMISALVADPVLVTAVQANAAFLTLLTEMAGRADALTNILELQKSLPEIENRLADMQTMGVHLQACAATLKLYLDSGPPAEVNLDAGEISGSVTIQ